MMLLIVRLLVRRPTKAEISRKILKKFNFIKEAYFKENFFFEGEFYDSEVYSLLKGYKNLLSSDQHV